MNKREAEKEAKEWLEKHAVLLGPEELPFEEEKLVEALVLRDGRWPVPRPVQHMGIFAEILDDESFNRVVGEPENWRVILDRSDLYHSWIVPQAAVIFGQTWFNRAQWKSSIRRGVPFSLFSSDERQAAKETGVSLADTPAGRTMVYKIVSRVEHALDVYLAGGGRSKIDGRIKQPGGYIVESIANEFIRDAGADMGFRLVRVRACPNCLATRCGRGRRSEVRHTHDNLYQCEQCVDTVRNLDLAISSFRNKEEEVPQALLLERQRASCFAEFSGIVCVCPNDACSGHFVPISCADDPQWWATPTGRAAWETALRLRAPKGSQSFKEAPEPLRSLLLRCPFCSERFTPGAASASTSGFRGQSGKLTGLPSIFIWVRREACAQNVWHTRGTTLAEAVADTSCVDPTCRITAEQRVRVLVGELAIHAQKLGRRTAPAVVSCCFYEAVAEWMLKYPGDASRYFFDWCAGERKPTPTETDRSQNCTVRRTTVVSKGRESAIHQTILYAWLWRISERMGEIRRIEGSKIRSLEDLKWFCRPPAYDGGPKTTFKTIVGDGLRIHNASCIKASGQVLDKPRMVWVFSVRKVDADGLSGPELVRHLRMCEWQTIKMSGESGLMPGDQVKVVALMMPGHHCHAPIQRIIRLRTSLLAGMIDRIRSEEAGGKTDASFWREWQRRAEVARKATGIGAWDD